MNNRKSKFTAGKILRLLEQHHSELAYFGVQKIGLFGSYRRGDPTGESDMDFLVVLDKPSFDSYMGVKIFLEDLFGCKVDLVLEIIRDILENKLPGLRAQVKKMLEE